MCKCTPEMRTPFCGKPGCEWPAQTATQMRERQSESSFRPNMRMQRAQMFAAQVMRIIDRDICDHTEDVRARQRLHSRLIDLFYSQGFDTVTDQDRTAAGLLLRDDDGWAPEELRAMELRRIEMLSRPMTVPKSADADAPKEDGCPHTISGDHDFQIRGIGLNLICSCGARP